MFMLSDCCNSVLLPLCQVKGKMKINKIIVSKWTAITPTKPQHKSREALQVPTVGVWFQVFLT